MKPVLPTRSAVAVDFDAIPVSAAPAGRVQTKLVLGQPGDRFEREADAVADRVMRDEHAGATSAAANGVAQRKCSTCQEEDEKVMPMAAPSGLAPALGDSGAAGIQSSRGGGQPMNQTLRADLEPRFGRSFSDVRIHADTRAAGLARGIGARAFTVGSDVFFGPGEFRPEAREGRHLLAHELTHVLQQRG